MSGTTVEMWDWDGWVVVGTLGVLFIILLKDIIPCDFAMAGALTIFMSTKIVNTAEGLEGFSNDGILTVAILYIVAYGIGASGSLIYIMNILIGESKIEVVSQIKLMLPIAFISAFLNNTPVVAMMIPVLTNWCNKLKVSPTKYFIPLSFASILGGTCTLIGTSTNLVVYARAQEEYGTKISIFDLSFIGVPILFIGLTYIIIFSKYLLPDNRDMIKKDNKLLSPKTNNYYDSLMSKSVSLVSINSMNEHYSNVYIITMQVLKESRLKFSKTFVNKTVNESNLNNMEGIHIIKIKRNKECIYNITGELILCCNDIIYFSVQTFAIKALQSIPQLSLTNNIIERIITLDLPNIDRCLIEAVLSYKSNMIYQSIKESDFYDHFNAVIIGVKRSYNFDKESPSVESVKLYPGDILLLDTNELFIKENNKNHNFSLINKIPNSNPPQFNKIFISLTTMILCMILFFFFEEHVSFVVFVAIASGIMLLCKCLNTKEARNSINWEVIITIACAFGISNALENSRVATTLGDALVQLSILTNTGEIGVLFCIYLATSLLSSIIANNAAALLMFPIAAEIINELGYSREKMLFILMYAASASFKTPFGYQTNLMVYQPGQYIFKDFLKFGIPMEILLMITSVIMVMYNQYWWIYWLISISMFAIISALIYNNASKKAKIVH